MKRLSIILIILLGMTALGYSQQDPDDPGIQDSIIVGDVYIDSGQTFAFVPVYAVSDDSVFYYNVPLMWIAPNGGVYGTSGNQYFPPLTSWGEIYDTAMVSENYQREFGFNDLNLQEIPPLFTNGLRLHIWSIRFVISPTAPSQLVVLDTTWDDRNYSIMLGLIDGMSEITPGFQRGYISIGGVGIDTGTEPSLFSLSQNYPNPFNSSTVISYSLPDEGYVSLIVYDIMGRKIRTLVENNLPSGEYNAIWDGRDDGGTDAVSGVYFYRLLISNNSESRRMLLIH